MAEIVTIGDQEFKKRGPLAVWGLSFITIAVYYFVWYYKVNDETRRYLGDDSIKPGLSVLALFVPIVNFVSIYRTGERIGRMQQNAGITNQLSPVIGLLASLLLALHIPYLQSEANKVWDRYLAGAAGPQIPSATPLPPPPPSAPPVVPPPPPPPES